MKQRAIFALVLSVCVAGSLAAARAANVQIASNGTFALQGAKTHINAQMIATALGPALSWDLQFTFAHSGARIPITGFDVEMTKPMHLIVIDDKMQSFQHLHPRLDPSGTFHQRVNFPKTGYYHIYADTKPTGSDQQVFRFDFVGGSLSSRPPPRKLKPVPVGTTTVRAGPYRVAFTIPALGAGSMAMIGVQITKRGKPATDLVPYLGAPAHVVMISTRDLSYIHAHPAPEGAGAMMVHVTPGVRGTYKLWLQFANSAGAIYVAPLSVAVK